MNWAAKEWVFTQSIKPKDLPITDYFVRILSMNTTFTQNPYSLSELMTSNTKQFLTIEFLTLNMLNEFSVIKKL